MIRSEGEKMAKSVGNIFLLREVLNRYADAAHGDAPAVLMYFLTTHYRSPLEFSTEKLDEAKAQYERLAGFVRDVDFRTARAERAGEGAEEPWLRQRIEETRRRFGDHMDDDLNTAGALGELFALVGDVYRYLAKVDAGQQSFDAAALRAARAEVTELAGILLVRLPEPQETEMAAAANTAACATGELALPPAAKLAAEGRWDDIELLYRERLACSDPSYAVLLRDHYRELRDWARSDALREELQAAGFAVRDTKVGTQVVPLA
jgi:cysteinyl-tRNA synthetase